MHLIYEPYTRFIRTTGGSKDKVSEIREAHFMIQPLSVKGNDLWTFISLIHNITYRDKKFDIT